jgi:hypothetical protein
MATALDWKSTLKAIRAMRGEHVRVGVSGPDSEPPYRAGRVRSESSLTVMSGQRFDAHDRAGRGDRGVEVAPRGRRVLDAVYGLLDGAHDHVDP